MGHLSDTDLETIIAAWARGDVDALTATSDRFGLRLTLPALELLDSQLGRAMTRKDVLVTLHQARDREIVVCEVDVPGSYPASKDICLAVRRADHVMVEVRHAAKRTRVGDRWEVRPWHRELARNRPGLATWLDTTMEHGAVFEVTGEPALASAEHRALLDEIIAHPADDGPRLVFADYLMDRDDLHGELIRLQCEAATVTGTRFGELWPRVTEIVRDHGARIAGAAAEHALSYRLHRGFVEAVTMTVGVFRRHGEQLFRSHPIQQLTPRPITSAALTSLATVPALSRVHHLTIGHTSDRGDVTQLAALGASRFLDGLRVLEIDRFATDDSELANLFTALVAPHLARITIANAALGARGLRALGDNPNLPALRELRLSGTSARKPCPCLYLDASSTRLLVDSLNGARLHRLELVGCHRIDDAVIRAITEASSPLALRYIDLTFSPVTVDGLRLLLDSAATPHLVRLGLRATAIPQGDLIELFTGLPSDHRLRHVELERPVFDRLGGRYRGDW